MMIVYENELSRLIYVHESTNLYSLHSEVDLGAKEESQALEKGLHEHTYV